MSTEGFSQGESTREQELLRHAGDIVVELRPDGRIVFVSQSVERVLSRPPKFFTDLSFLEVIVPEDRERTLAEFRKVVEVGAEALVSFRVARLDGVRIQLETTLRSFIDRDDRQRIVAVCRDTTDQSSFNAANRRRDHFYRLIAESGSRPAAIISFSGRIHFANHSFIKTFGDNHNVQDFRSRMSAESRSTADAAWYQTSRPTSTGRAGADFQYANMDGSTSWFSANWEAVSSDGESNKFAVLFEDITRRKRIEQALRTIAGGILWTESKALRRTIAMIAEALEMDRLVLGLVNESTPEWLDVLVAWQDGDFLADESIALDGLPDLLVARGETMIHPIAVGQLMPAVVDCIGHEFVSYAGVPLRDPSGNVVGIIGGYGRKTIHDTDLVRSLLSAFATHVSAAIDRKHANAEVRANQARFDALALHADEVLVEIDSDLRIKYVSHASLTILGFEPKSLLGQTIEELTHPNDVHILMQARDRILSGHQDAVTETRCLHADGSWRWIESRTSSFRASETSSRTLILARDITERRRGELGRDLLYQVVQRGADLVFVCEADTTLLFANDAASRLLHRPTSNAVEGQRFLDLLTVEDSKRVQSEILPTMSPAAPWSGELQLIDSQDGSAIPTEATIFLFQGREETPGTYLAVTLHDITQRRAAEEALRQSEMRLSQAQKMEAVGRLAGGIAHDFNNLLTAIIGYSDLVLDQLGEGHGSRRDTEEILRAAERAGGLTRQLLAFSRRQVLQPESVDLNAVVADIDRMMRRLIGENIELVTIQDGELHRIIADPGQIEQVIVNLVVNARDAIPHGGRIEVETANFTARHAVRTDSGTLSAGDYALLRVSDNGMGMDESVRAQIFEPFFTTKEAHEGTGLGLASAYGIVSQSGGQIDVVSAPQKGTTFTIYLPAALAQSVESEPKKRDEYPCGTETILLVEDSEPVRRLVQRTLEKSGYTVLAAESATAALRFCSRHSGTIDLLFTDVVLPKTSGPEIARRATELRPGLRVLFMSGFTDETLTRHGLRPGISQMLEKPFAPAVVLSKVRSLLDADPKPLSDTVFPVEHS